MKPSSTLLHKACLPGASALVLLILFASCETTSLSNPRGSADEIPVGTLASSVGSGQSVTESEIGRALQRVPGQGHVRLRPGDSVFLVQSGALIPDPELRAAVEQSNEVVPGDGRGSSYGWASTNRSNQSPTVSPDELARRIRLAAAQAGCPRAMVVFGEFQTLSKDLATSTVSWVPIVGQVIPDRRSGTRLLVQAMIIDTATGRWSIVAAPPQEVRGLSSEVSRTHQVSRRAQRLKKRSYPALATLARGE